MSSGNTAIIADEHPWVSPLPLPSRQESRRGLLAPVDAPVGRKQRPKLFYAAIAVTAVVGIVVVQLALSIIVSNGAYKISSLQTEQKELGRDYQAASEADDKLSSPQNLAANADALGMVPNSAPVYLRLSDGKVIGQPVAAAAAPAQKTNPDQSLVPNSLLKGVPLVTAKGQKPSTVASDPSPSTNASQKTSSGTPVANVEPQNNGPVAWDGPLPSPETH